ncbi:MAG: carboxypeptidase-like regulatory domain-containing protein, partial [Thermoanaerobaculia bacterium]
MSTTNFWRRALIVTALLLLAGAPASAQLQSGNVQGNVVDEQGAALPGVTVTLSGLGAPQVFVTDAQGNFRFLGLAPGRYQLSAALEGFSTVEYPNVSVSVGRNTAVEITMSSAVEDVITVTAESPLLDERKITTGTTVSEVELEKIPTARDPWV